MRGTERLAALLLLLASPTLFLPAPAAAGQQQEPPPGGAVEGPWQGPEGPLPFETEEQLKDFLRTAEVVSQKELTGGVNRPLKVRLEGDGIAANAIFRIVDIRRKRARLDGKLVADFHDSFIYECAAYEVSRMLGIDNVPPCVPRRYRHTDGTMQLWVENAMTEKARRDAGQEPPKLIRWLRQKQTMRLFDALIYNFDRNQGNMLIDPDWKLWFIDHTRSFRKSPLVEKIEKIVWVQREVWARLQALERKEVARRLRPLVSPLQVNFMFKRRDKLVEHLQAKIDRMGEGAVLFDPATEAPAADVMELVIDDDIPETSSRLEEPLDEP